MYDISPQVLASLVDPKNPEGLQKLGGIKGLAESLNVNLQRGLPDSGTADVNDPEMQRVEKYGRNILPKRQLESFWHMLFGAAQDKVMIMLMIAAIVSVVLGVVPYTSHDPKLGWIEGVAILVAVLLVILVSTINDYQKQKQFEKLNDKKNDRVVKVVRDGNQKQVPVADIKVGDIVMVDTGDIVCADGVYLEGHSVKCDESSITGESDPVRKGIVEQGLDPFYISGSQVLEGFGTVLIIAVGTNSFMGRTMLALQVPDETTPLQNKLEHLAASIGKVGLLIAILLLVIAIPKYFITNTSQGRKLGSEAPTDIVRFVIGAITIIVVAVPEGLPLAVTMALAYSMMKMLKDNNLVRHLAACETMGGATNICSDKTGTLTQNVMTVVSGWFGGSTFEEYEANLGNKWKPQLFDILFESIATNSSAFESTNDKGKTEFIGSKTESALLLFIQKLGQDYKSLRSKATIKQLYPFSSAKKRMSVLIEKNAGYRFHCKGASEIVLEMCTHVMHQEGDSVTMREIDQYTKAQLLAQIHNMASDALRTICIAYKDVHEHREDWTDPPEQNLVLLAILGIRDPLRPEVPEAVRQCQSAGITVRMVTGDNIVTAENIARKCGILMPGGICMEGPKFRELSQKEMDLILPNLQVLARSSPTDKQLLVGRLKELGEVVAVTGDGTNDGPALKMADIGFSMGIAGTEVAISASDVVLLDDNFASIVKAVMWGRNVFDAIRKFLQFQLTVNVVAVTIAFVGTISGDGESPLTAVQLLWVNLIMDTLAALALATEPPTLALLERKPYGRKTKLITKKMWRNIMGHSIYQLLVSFVLLYAGPNLLDIKEGSTEHYTLVFNSFVFMQLCNEINSRKLEDEKNPFKGLLQNRVFMVVLVVTAAIQALIVEFGGRPMSTAPLNGTEWLVSILVGFVEVPYGILLRYFPVANNEVSPGNEKSAVLEKSETSITIPNRIELAHRVSFSGQTPDSPNNRKDGWTSSPAPAAVVIN